MICRLQHATTDESERKHSSKKKEEKYQATLVEQKRNYQRHLRSLQRKTRTETTSNSNDSQESWHLTRRQKCFGISSPSQAMDCTALSSSSSSQSSIARPFASSSCFWSPAHLFPVPDLTTHITLPAFYFQTPNALPRKVRTRILQSDTMEVGKKEERLSSFCVESLLRP